MRRLPDQEVLALWEQGAVRQALDRTLLLCAAARPGLPPAAVPDLPLGEVNTSLIRLRAALYGGRVDCWAECVGCGAPFELTLELAGLLRRAPAAPPADAGLRLPTLRDLAAVAAEPDVASAARRLLARCSARPTAAWSEAELDQAGAAIDALDPMTDLSVRARCPGCGLESTAELDIGQLLWRDLDAHARALLEQVHLLAQAYGWSERQVLALGAARRAAYLQMVAP
jgi:hypothetical protein